MKGYPCVKDSLGRIYRVRWIGLGFMRCQDQKSRNYVFSFEQYLSMYFGI